MAPTYLETLAHFTNFLTAYIHTILYLRTLYPRTTFTTSRFHNTPVHQSRHPLVCEWITDAVAAVRNELLAGTVAKIGIVVFSYGKRDEGTGSVQIMERYMLDVSQFPKVARADRNTEIEYEGASDPDPVSDQDVAGPSNRAESAGKAKGKMKALDTDTTANLSEQFRAAFITLTSRTSQLAPLPPNCSFNVSMELKDEPDIDPPVGHPQPWIPVQPSLQKTGRKGAQQSPTSSDESGEGKKEGQDLGGLKVTPIRSVEAGVFRFETWVEEGRAKFEGGERSKGSSADSER